MVYRWKPHRNQHRTHETWIWKHMEDDCPVPHGHSCVRAWVSVCIMLYPVGTTFVDPSQTSEVTFGTLLSVAAHAINVLPWTSPRQGSQMAEDVDTKPKNDGKINPTSIAA